MRSLGCVFFFFFQAEDGIRDLTVTGVQTCALPIYHRAENAVRPSRHFQPYDDLVALLQRPLDKLRERPVRDAGLHLDRSRLPRRVGLPDRRLGLRVPPSCPREAALAAAVPLVSRQNLTAASLVVTLHQQGRLEP